MTTAEQAIITTIDQATRDTRTEAERRYDAERDGSLYRRGDLIDAVLEYTADDEAIIDWILRESDANARLNAALEAEERMSHGTIIDPGGPGRVRIERQVCTDHVDKDSYGKEWGTRYFVGMDTDEEVEIFIPDHPKHGAPDFYAFGNEGIPPDEVRRTLPNIIALFSDPRVSAALAAWPEREEHAAA